MSSLLNGERRVLFTALFILGMMALQFIVLGGGSNSNASATNGTRTVDRQGLTATLGPLNSILTDHGIVADIFDNPMSAGPLCCGSAVGIVLLIFIVSFLSSKYKQKGAAWAVPLIIAFFIVAMVTLLASEDSDLKIPMWWVPWFIGLMAIVSCVVGVATLVTSASYSVRSAARIFGVAAAPTLIALLVIFIVSMINSNPEQKHIKVDFFAPLLILCIIGSVSIAVGRVALAKARQQRWAAEEAKRVYDKRVEEYNAKMTATKNTLDKLGTRIDGHKMEAPGAMYNEVMRCLREAWNAYEQANNVDQAAYLDTAKTQADATERNIVDLEAFLVARQQAKDTLAGLKARVDVLTAKRAPTIDVANGLYSEAVRKLTDAQTLPEVKVAFEAISKGSAACEESATSLKGAEDQLTDLKVQVAQLSSRVADLRNNPKELAAASKVGALLSGINGILIAQTAKPDIDTLAKGREQVRQAQSIIQTADDRERQRAGIASDIESLTADVNDVSNWSTENLDEISKAISKATAALNRDDLSKGRDAIDLGFNRLEEIKAQSIPALTLIDKDYDIQVNKWEDLSVELKNNGNASAQDIEFEIQSPSAELLDVKDKAKTTYKIKANDTTIVPVKIQFTAEGAVPTTIIVNYKDALDREYHEEIPLRVNVVPKMFLSPAQAPAKKLTAEDYGLTIKKFGTINQGFYKFKVSIQNKGKVVAREVNFRLIFDKKTFRLHHIQPSDLKLIGDSVDYGDIDPTTTRSCEFYLEAHMCTESKLDGTITFKDIEGKIQMMPIETHAVTFACPTFIDAADVSPAQVKELLTADGWKQDTKTFAVPSNLDLQFIFDSMKESIEKYDPNLKHVFDDCQNDPVSMESWYYGETEGAAQSQGVKHIVIGKVTRMQKAGSTLLITGASMHQGQLFALSTRLGLAVSDGITKAANLSRPIQQIFQTVEIKDSVLTGSTISMGTGGVGTATGDTTGKVSVKDSVMVRSDISGGKDVEVQGSVMQRTKVGAQPGSYQPGTCPPPQDAPPPKLADPMREFQYNVYRDTLRQVYEDGQVTVDERAILKRLRGQLNISNDEHSTLEEEILAEYAAKNKQKQ